MAISVSERVSLLETGLLLGDRWVHETAAGTMDHTNPATGKVQKSFPVAGRVEIEEAVAAARAAFPAWRDWRPDERRLVLQRIAHLIGERGEEFGVISALEGGGPFSSRGSSVAASWFDYYAGWADKIDGSVYRPYSSRGLDYTLPEPVGVVAVIITWNGPIGFFGMSVAPALAAGCCVVLKAPELAPFSSSTFGRLCLEAGLPAGVLNIVTGGPECGDALVRHPGIDKISFTGGTATARIIQASAAESLTPMVMELGGKSANIVFEDADLERATVLAARFTNANGQGCSLPTRLLLQDSIHDRIVDQLLLHLQEKVVVGDPFDPRTTMGPVISEVACERILSLIDRARDDGAGKVVLGGERLGGDLAEGFFVPPTVFVNVNNSSEIAQNEIFGPVLSVLRFSDEDEAVALANDTHYGLAAYVQTNDISRGHRLASRLEAGNVHLNGSGPGPVSPSTPFGGIKQSGYGRQGARVGLDEFLHTKNVFVNL